MFPRFIWQLISSKNPKTTDSLATTEPRERISRDLEYLECYNFLCTFEQKLKSVKFYLTK
jgi:hypothetical protein